MEYKGINYNDPKRLPIDRRFKPFEPKKVWTVSKIWELHHEIKRRILLGQKNVDIARELGICAQQVSNVRNSPVIQDQLAIMSAERDAATVDIAKQIKELAPIALMRLKEIITKTGPGKDAPIGLVAKEANGILDRAGFSPVKKFEGVIGHLTNEDIDELKKRARGVIVEAEYRNVA